MEHSPSSEARNPTDLLRYLDQVCTRLLDDLRAHEREGKLGAALGALLDSPEFDFIAMTAPLVEKRHPDLARMIPGFSEVVARWSRTVAEIIGQQWRLNPAYRDERAALDALAARAAAGVIVSGKVSYTFDDAKLAAVMAALWTPPAPLPAVPGVPQAVMAQATDELKDDQPEQPDRREDVEVDDTVEADAAHPLDPLVAVEAAEHLAAGLDADQARLHELLAVLTAAALGGEDPDALPAKEIARRMKPTRSGQPPSTATVRGWRRQLKVALQQRLAQ